MEFYDLPGQCREWARRRMLTIEQVMKGARVQMFPAYGTFKQPARVKGDKDKQLGLDGDG